jgi:hypothetical protein
MAIIVTFTVPNDFPDMVVFNYPIPTDKPMGGGTPLFTKGQWAKEVYRRYLTSQYRDWKIRLATTAAIATVNVPDDTVS